MSETEQRVYDLLDLAGKHQAAVQAALQGLETERIALTGERTTLARQVQALQEAMTKAVQVAVTESLVGVTVKVAETVKAQTEALEHNVGVMAKSVADAEFALQRIIAWASWRFLGLVAVILAVLGIGGWLASNGILLWDTQKIAQEQSQKDQLQQDIAGLQANKATWVQAGMLDKISRCGSDNQPCVGVNDDAGPFGYPGGPQNLRILQGY